MYTVQLHSTLTGQGLDKYKMHSTVYTVPKENDFLRYIMKSSGENVKLCGIFHVVSCFPLHFKLYRGNLDYFLDSVQYSCSGAAGLIFV